MPLTVKLTNSTTQRIFNYTLIDRIGTGETSDVYTIEHHPNYVCKVYKSKQELSLSHRSKEIEATRKYFQQTLKVDTKPDFALINDYSVLPVLTNENEPQYGIIMPRTPGKTLRKLIAETKDNKQELIKILTAVFKAIYNYHRAELVHGNLHTDNIFVNDIGNNKKTRFINHECQHERNLLTAQYDENKEHIDSTVDVYKLALDLSSQIPRWYRGIRAVLLGCLADDPADRYGSRMAYLRFAILSNDSLSSIKRTICANIARDEEYEHRIQVYVDILKKLPGIGRLARKLDNLTQSQLQAFLDSITNENQSIITLCSLQDREMACEILEYIKLPKKIRKHQANPYQELQSIKASSKQYYEEIQVASKLINTLFERRCISRIELLAHHISTLNCYIRNPENGPKAFWRYYLRDIKNTSLSPGAYAIEPSNRDGIDLLLAHQKSFLDHKPHWRKLEIFGLDKSPLVNVFLKHLSGRKLNNASDESWCQALERAFTKHHSSKEFYAEILILRLRLNQSGSDFDDERKESDAGLPAFEKPSAFIEDLLQCFVEENNDHRCYILAHHLCKSHISKQLNHAHALGLTLESFYKTKPKVLSGQDRKNIKAIIYIVRVLSHSQADIDFLTQLRLNPKLLKVYIDIACIEPWDHALAIIKGFRQSFKNPRMPAFWNKLTNTKASKIPRIISALYINKPRAGTYRDLGNTLQLIEDLAWMWDTDTIQELATAMLIKLATFDFETVSIYIQLHFKAQEIEVFVDEIAKLISADKDSERLNFDCKSSITEANAKSEKSLPQLLHFFKLARNYPEGREAQALAKALGQKP